MEKILAEKTVSEQYVLKMGTGLNLGNSFDAFDRVNFTKIDDETAWGNPLVTSEYMNALKEIGFSSIRIPFTAFTRIEEDYRIDEVFLNRYETVVNYALDAGFYVMINLHHDSGEWLIKWDGNTSSEEYIKFIALWTQLAERFKDYGDRLMFESMNEIFFENQTDDKLNEMVAAINKGFYELVRASGGNNTTRMLVIPTVYTNHQLIYSQYTTDFINSLNDENLIATVHYYVVSMMAYTSNIGVSMFDEEFNNSTPRLEVSDDFYTALEATFIENGIGVIIGEYGLLNIGAPGIVQDGELVKFIEFMTYKAKTMGICTMIWERGVIINRNTAEFINATWGNIIKASITDRSSYAKGLDHLFVSTNEENDIDVPLVLNGNSLSAIYNGANQLTEGVEYSYANETVTLSGNFVSSLITGGYGIKADLRFVFTSGSDWHQYISYTGTPSLDAIDAPVREDDGFMASYDTDGTPTYPSVIISAHFNGQIIRRMASFNSAGEPESANTYASQYMQYGSEFTPANDSDIFGSDILCLMNWYYNAISNDTFTLVIDFYDGTTIRYRLTKENDHLTGSQIIN